MDVVGAGRRGSRGLLQGEVFAGPGGLIAAMLEKGGHVFLQKGDALEKVAAAQAQGEGFAVALAEGLGLF